ncbi:hypothetical protein GDO86_010289, partial [Hymenochirus boettgeri]
MNCSNTTKEVESSIQLLNILATIPLFVLGIACNGLALWVFCSNLKNWNVTIIYMVNLIISDVTVLLTFPFRLYAYLYTSDLGKSLCKALINLYVVNMYMSIFTITAIAIDRYLAIVFPIKAKQWRSPVKAIVICCTLWSIHISLAVILVLTQKDSMTPVCFQKANHEPRLLHIMFVIAGFIFPLAVVSFCTGRVIMTLYGKEVPDVNEQKSIRKAIKIIISNFVVFIICFLPVHVGYTIRFVAETVKASCYIQDKVQVFIHVAVLVANSNCVLDSVCYYFAASEFWKAS